MKVVSLPRERISQSRRQLMEFLKLTPNERITNYRTLLKPAILRLYSVLSSVDNGYDFSEIDMLKRDSLHVDVEIIAFNYNENHMISYLPYKALQELSYPEVNYEIVEKENGMCKDSSTGNIFFSKRIAIDFALEDLAKKWLEKIPQILELL